MTLREYILFWQETYDRHQSRPTTYAAHNYVFKNHILPGLGDVLLSELTSERVGEFLEERKHFGNHRPGSSGLGWYDCARTTWLKTLENTGFFVARVFSCYVCKRTTYLNYR